MTRKGKQKSKLKSMFQKTKYICKYYSDNTNKEYSMNIHALNMT